ncbi:MAG: hypothetical protein M3Q87_00935 [Actinomycetota bacterium]|nr:hypothetical protein [Actinomycetota bacterium]
MRPTPRSSQRHCGRPARDPGLLVAYVLGMTFALVVSGEHYVIDALLGWGYVAGAPVGWDRLQPWWGG